MAFARRSTKVVAKPATTKPQARAVATPTARAVSRVQPPGRSLPLTMKVATVPSSPFLATGHVRTFSMSRKALDKLSEKKEEIEEAAREPNADDPEVQAMLQKEREKLEAEETDEAERKKAEVLIEETEKVTGAEQKMEFQSDTKKILDIVTRSLYSEREVFVRELISNASDALEKLKYKQVTGEIKAEGPDAQLPLEVRISVDDKKKTITIQDTGIGMTKEEMVDFLGRIGHSGTGEFLKLVEKNQSGNLIGQFGVGFYSAFMVSKRVKVYSKSAKSSDDRGYVWTSDGSGTYTMAEADGVQRGTKVIMELNEQSNEFASREAIENAIKKYSNFVGFDITLNGSTVNTVKAIWTLPKDKVTEQEHKEFFQFISHSYDSPMYHLHYVADTPISVRALFYVPEQHMEKYGLGVMEPGVNLFSRKVLIQAKCKGLLPDWLRFIKGVVDSEEIPLNISRESLQDSTIIKRLQHVLTRRILKYLEEEAKTNNEKYEKFYKEFQQFLKQGICTDLKFKEDIAKLLRVESSKTNPDQLTSLDKYVDGMHEKQKNIYYLCITNRSFADNSPYYEAFKEKNVEVLFLYTNIDDFVMTNLAEYRGKKLVSIESGQAAEELHEIPSTRKDEEDKSIDAANELTGDALKDLTNWLKETLVARVTTVTSSARLSVSPAVVVDHESASFRRMMKYVDPSRAPTVPKLQLEINPKHKVVIKLADIRFSDPELAKDIAEQIMDNALVQAGLMEDPRSLVPRLNKILERVVSQAGK